MPRVFFQSYGDYLELMFMISEGSHKEHIAKLLTLTHPETEAFSSMASHLVVRLINLKVLSQ